MLQDIKNVTTSCVQDWSGGAGSGGNSISNCLGWPYSQSITAYVTPPIQIRAINNAVMVQVGYINNGPTPGEYAFKDMAEAAGFIKDCMEKMLPK
jgi:hypothetical protein